MKTEPLKCANPECGMSLFNLKTTDYGTPIVKVDDIIVCGSCGALSKVAIEGTRPLTKTELDNISDEEKKDLDFAVRALRRHQ